MKISKLETLYHIEYNVSDLTTALPKWYFQIRNKSIEELSDDDIARCLRQSIFLDYIIPEAIERITLNIAIGDLYAGEIFYMLIAIDKNVWKNNSKLRNTLEMFFDSLKKENVFTDQNMSTTESEELFNLYEKAIYYKENFNRLFGF